MRTLPFCILMLALAPPARGQAQRSSPRMLGEGVVLERPLGPSDSSDFTVRLAGAMSALLSVQQLGIDAVIEVRAPDGKLLQAVDSPTGRTGDERVEIFADRSGAYGVRVRPYSTGEPQGRFRLTVVELRDAQATAALLAARARERDAAATWLRQYAARLPDEIVGSLPPLDELAGHARVIALGEATHGSREITDLRFAVTRYLVQRHRVRLIAIEYSSSRLDILNTWALGGPVKGDVSHARRVGEGAFVAQLPNDPRDRLEVSSLPAAPPETIDGVMGSAYGTGAVATWGCDPRPRDVPPWLQHAEPLHWVGGIFEPGSLPSEAFRPFKLLSDFDGIFYVRKVTADQIFSDRPVVPARRR